MAEEIKKGNLVYCWDYDPKNAIRQFFLALVPNPIAPVVVYSDTGCVSQWKHFSKEKP